MVDLIRILQKHPSLMPRGDYKTWQGIIYVQGEQVCVTISTPFFPSLQGFSLICPVSLEIKIKKLIEQFNVETEPKNFVLHHLLDFLKSKRDLANENEEETGWNGCWIESDYCLYKQVLSELRQVGSEHVVACGAGLRDITLRTTDVRGFEHRLVLGLGPQYPTRTLTIVQADLPQVALTQLAQADTITQVFKVFKSLIDSYQEFWNTIDSLMRNTWVIDPEHPSFKDTQCRIIIGENVSMVVTLNPQDVNSCPDIKFLGPETAVTPFINSMEAKLKTIGWNEDASMLDNLLSLLGLSHFPLRELDDDVGPQQEECSICFMARLEDQVLPTKVCNNTKCNSYFHISCLAQWFQAVPTNETSFNLISGDCPSCGEKILCPIKLS